MKKLLTMRNLEIILFIFLARLLFKVDFSTLPVEDFYFKSQDIYYEFQAAKQIHNGENPYLRIKDSNMLDNEKYATQLPLYFYTLSIIRNFSDAEFSDFIDNFRYILYFSQIVGGLFIYLFFRRINKKFLGMTAALIYVFNVWTLNSFIFLKQDMIAIALLLASFYYFRHQKFNWLSYLFFGLSLGIKHIGIFVLPLYLTPLVFDIKNYKKYVLDLVILLVTVLAPTLPFLIDDPTSLIKSMLFSVTRSPSTSDVIYGYSELLVQYNRSVNTGTLFQQMLPRLPLLISTLLVVVLLFTKKIPASLYLLLSVLVFAIFNPVIFPQYITWIPPLALISLGDFYKS